MKRIISIGILFLIVCFVVSLLFYRGVVRMNYPSQKEYPIQGIDVSHHQGEIDWTAVQQQNIRFVFMKATEGGDFKDKRFQENWKNAQAVGLDVGGYHFFTFCRTGKQQAENFIARVPYLAEALPPVVDLEYGGNCKLKKSKQAVLAELNTFNQLLEEHYKKQPIFYVTKEFYEDFLVGKDYPNPIWLRDVYQEPTLKDGKKWTFWQYANRGKLKGIDTYVDLNVFAGNEEAYFNFKK